MPVRQAVDSQRTADQTREEDRFMGSLMETQAAPQGGSLNIPQQGPRDAQKDSEMELAKAAMEFHQRKNPLRKFLKGEPKALGVIQIMIGLMNFSLGNILDHTFLNQIGQPFLFHSGYTFWGPAFFILSGSLSIAAENRTTKGLVKSSLGLNIVSVLVSGMGIYLLLGSLGNIYSIYQHYTTEPDVYPVGFSILFGINGLLLVFTFLEFIIAITLAGFGCPATCCNQGEVTILMPFSPYMQEVPTAETPKEGIVIRGSNADGDKFPGSHAHHDI
ncbi:membrane-spanning 4-domains subfamily A member 4A-like isoform X1 [Notamacropus eugenii]|uniref:membrane-spanning 4-domains subfamily A member 4A-like isoform X1 n=1 Tax=Notamacropus eugenii TaxID=9315 RepID=UPI003B6845FF